MIFPPFLRSLLEMSLIICQNKSLHEKIAWRYPETQKDECYIHRGGVGNAHSDVSENSSSEALSDLDRISEEQLYLARKSEGIVMNFFMNFR